VGEIKRVGVSEVGFGTTKGERRRKRPDISERGERGGGDKGLGTRKEKISKSQARWYPLFRGVKKRTMGSEQKRPGEEDPGGGDRSEIVSQIDKKNKTGERDREATSHSQRKGHPMIRKRGGRLAQEKLSWGGKETIKGN